MIKKYTRKITKEIDENYGLKITCDICGKVICDFDDTPPNYPTGQSVRYFSLRKGHNDWGNDSIDSIEYKEICSEDCVKTALVRYFNESQGSNTAYFELRKERAYKIKGRTGEVLYYAR